MELDDVALGGEMGQPFENIIMDPAGENDTAYETA